MSRSSIACEKIALANIRSYENAIVLLRAFVAESIRRRLLQHERILIAVALDRRDVLVGDEREFGYSELRCRLTDEEMRAALDFDVADCALSPQGPTAYR